MKRWIAFSVVLIALVVGSVRAFERIGFHLLVDFTDPKAARENAEWTQRTPLDINQKGLGCSDDSRLSSHTEILTRPLAIGTDWRPAIAAGVEVKVVSPPAFGIMYVRYSPDRKHWSTWQRLEEGERKQDDDFLSFHGDIGVTNRDREQYGHLLNEYRRRDVPWGDDEAAAVRWIVHREPDFFAKNLPFVGYLQFLYEVTIDKGQRLRSLEAEVSGGVSGLEGSPTKDSAEYARRDAIPWSYVSP